MASAVKSVAALSAARVASAGLQFAILPIIARYLSPEEFGLVALAMVFVTISIVLADAGIGKSLIRDETLDQRVWSSAFWLLAALGLALALLVLGSAPLIAWIFNAPDLLLLTSALAVVPLFQSLSTVFLVELEKQQAIFTLALITVGVTCVSSLSAVVLAVMGMGAWALVGQQIVFFGLQGGVVLCIARFRPDRQFALSSLGEHLRFGRDTVGWSLLQMVHRQSLTVALGKFGSMPQLGAFAMANRFARLPQLAIGQPVGRVFYVRMAARHKREGAVKDLFLIGTQVLAAIVIPPMLLIAASGHAFFTFVLGENWAGVASVFAILAPGSAIQVALSLNGSAFMASGHTGLRLRSMVETLLLWLFLMVLAIPFGFVAILGARTLAVVVYLPRITKFTNDAFGASLGDVLRCLTPALGFGLLGVGLHLWLVDQLEPTRIQELLLAFFVLLSTWSALAAQNFDLVQRWRQVS